MGRAPQVDDSARGGTLAGHQDEDKLAAQAASLPPEDHEAAKLAPYEEASKTAFSVGKGVRLQLMQPAIPRPLHKNSVT